MSSPFVVKPTFEQHHSGLGIGQAEPRVSWQFEVSESTVSSWVQTAYEIEVTHSSDAKPRVYRTASDQSVLVPWPSRSLKSRDSASVRVRCFGKSAANSQPFNEDEITPWSASSTVEAGLLEEDEFQAKFITTSAPVDREGPSKPLRFRKEFALPDGFEKISKARLYVTALGVFEASLNGRPASDEHMAPGWTSYKHRLNYRTLDVTDLILPRKRNVLSAEVAHGWYAGTLGFNGGKRFIWGEDLALFSQLEVMATSGETFMLKSDDTWSCAPGSLQSSEIYHGEVYDMREDNIDFSSPDVTFDQSLLTATRILSQPSAKLVSPNAPPVRTTEKIKPIEIFRSKSGKTIIDFGQNLVGKLFIESLQLHEGAELSFKHAEVIEHGEIGTRPLRFAKSTDVIIGSGKVLQNWSPKFTFHGFRYVQVDGWPNNTSAPSKEDITALVMHTDMERRGFFNCSNASVNQLHRNVVWSMRGNFLSIPTDCPQRDERLGWTGDIQAFSPSASFLYNATGILENWLEDVAAEQHEDWRNGSPPLFVPDIGPTNWPHMPQAIWDDVTVIVPDVLHQYSGDKALLNRQFQSMQAWLDRGVDRGSDGLWNPDKWQLGDWLDPSAPPENPGFARTDNLLVANAYIVYVTSVFSRICSILGKIDLAKKHAGEYERLRARFQHKYITPEGNLMSNSQTGLSLAIRFGLYPGTQQLQVAANNLDHLVRAGSFHISTGFAGTPIVTHALSAVGRPQLAYRMLLEKSCPSWLYPVTMGATTVWERWDSMLPDGTINPGEMTSFNHYALGSVADWLHSTVGGLAPLGPGWKAARVRPIPGGNITHAETSFNGPYGLVECSWRLVERNRFEMLLTVPPNSTAVVTLPSDLRSVVSAEKETTRTVGSGTHSFKCLYDAGEWPPKPFSLPYESVPADDIAE